MLVKGNNKLGTEIFLFNLPSARKHVCKWMTPTCKRLCYDARQEKYRPTISKARLKNYQMSKRADFANLLIALISYLNVKLMRWHGGGEIYSVTYARKMLHVMKACPQTRFYFYTRAWRDSEIRRVLEKMSRLKNCRVWYSLDRDTGFPERTPARVRLAYLMASDDETVPAGIHLVFRPAEMRRKARTHVGGVRICPSEDGVKREVKIHCGNCSICHRDMPVERKGTLSLSMVPA